MATELGAARVPGAAEPEQAGKKKFGWWDFLNSQALLALLLAIAGGAWNVWQYVENKRKDDAQFLGNMLPYLTDSKIETRVRAIQIIEGRYSPGTKAVDLDDIPGNVRNLMCNSVPDFADFRHQMSNTLIDSADAFWKGCLMQTSSSAPTPTATPQGSPGATPTLSPAGAQTPGERARVYIQIYSEEQREGAAEVKQSLQKNGYIVPGIEDLSNTNAALASRPVTNTEVRYFNAADASAANNIYASLSAKKDFPKLNFSKLNKKGPALSPLRTNPGTIEIWFAPLDGVATNAGS